MSVHWTDWEPADSAGQDHRPGAGELATACTELAERAGGLASSPRLAGPATQMLAYAARALRLAADLIGLVPPYEHRCELGWSVFGSGGDWTICTGPLEAGRLRMPDAVRAGCLAHLASAVALDLGSLHADQDVSDAVADRIARNNADARDAGIVCELGRQTRRTTDLYYPCHGDRRLGRYAFAGTGRRPFGCIVHLVDAALDGVVGTIEAAEPAQAEIDQAIARRRAGGLPPGPLAAASLSRFRELSEPLRSIPPYPQPGPDDTSDGATPTAGQLTR
jgi:hypothetical protein